VATNCVNKRRDGKTCVWKRDARDDDRRRSAESFSAMNQNVLLYTKGQRGPLQAPHTCAETKQTRRTRTRKKNGTCVEGGLNEGKRLRKCIAVLINSLSLSLCVFFPLSDLPQTLPVCVREVNLFVRKAEIAATLESIRALSPSLYCSKRDRIFSCGTSRATLRTYRMLALWNHFSFVAANMPPRKRCAIISRPSVFFVYPSEVRLQSHNKYNI
jgi:hypothetical protein